MTCELRNDPLTGGRASRERNLGGCGKEDARDPNVQPLAVLSPVHLLPFEPNQRRQEQARSEEAVYPARVATLRGEAVVDADEDGAAGRHDVERRRVVPDRRRRCANYGRVTFRQVGVDGTERV